MVAESNKPWLAKHAVLVAILAVSLALKIALIAGTSDVAPIADEKSYLSAASDLDSYLRPVEFMETSAWRKRAKNIVGYGPYPSPGYIFFLYATSSSPLEDSTSSKLAQVFLGTLAGFFVFLFGRDLFGRRAGLIAAGLFCFYPTLVAFSVYHWSESVFQSLLIPGFYLLLRSQPTSSRANLAAAGLLLGVASLVRWSLFYFLFVCAGWLLLRALISRERRRALLSVAVFVVCAGLPVAPWLVFMHSHTDRVAVAVDAGRRMYIDNVVTTVNTDRPAPPFPDSAKRSKAWTVPPCDDDNLVDRDRCNFGIGLQFLLDHPEYGRAKLTYTFASLLNPTSFLIRNIKRGAYDVAPRLVLDGVVALSVAMYLLVVVAGLVGLVFSREFIGKPVLVLFLGYLVVGPILLWASSRFRLPVMPFLMVFASGWLANWRLFDLGKPFRVAIVAGLVAVFALTVVPQIGPIFE